MNADQIIEEVKEQASEWIEMCNNPDEFISGVLALKIVKLNNYIEYLEKRLNYAIPDADIRKYNPGNPTMARIEENKNYCDRCSRDNG